MIRCGELVEAIINFDSNRIYHLDLSCFLHKYRNEETASLSLPKRDKIW